MSIDDPRLSSIITPGCNGEIVIMGSPFDYVRKKSIHKGGEYLGPCCLRRFFGKVGPIWNCEYDINIQNLKLSDNGNIQFEENEESHNVIERCVTRIATEVASILKKIAIPFVLGGSKECLIGSARAFHQNYDGKHLLIASKPTVQPLSSVNQLNSENAMTLLNLQFPNKLVLFSANEKYCPPKLQCPTIFLSEIRNTVVPNNCLTKTLSIRTQGAWRLHKQLEDLNVKWHISLTVSSIERFKGHRDVQLGGLESQQIVEIFLVLGWHSNVMSIDINQFNPSCDQFESSLLIVNLLYYFAMGWTLRE